MTNEHLTSLIKLNELAYQKGDGDINFLSLLEVLIQNKIVDPSDKYAVRTFMSYEGEISEKSLFDYLNEKVQYNSSKSSLFLDFISKHYQNYYDPFSALNAIEEICMRIMHVTNNYMWESQKIENEENTEKLKDLVGKLTAEQLQSILLTESYEQKIYDNYKVSEKINNIRNKFLNNKTVRDIFIEKLNDINFIFEKAQFIQMIDVENYDFFENHFPDFWEKDVIVHESVRNEKTTEWEEKVSTSKAFEVIDVLTRDLSERYRNTDKEKEKRSYLYGEITGKVSETAKEKITSTIPGYIVKNPVPFEVLKLDNWFNYCDSVAFNTLIKKSIEADNSEDIYRTGFFDILAKAERDNAFQEFISKQQTSLFTLLLKYDKKTRFEYLDRSFKLDPRSTEIIPFRDMLRSEMHIKLSRLVKKYGVDNLLGGSGIEHQKLLIDDLLSITTHDAQSTYNGTKRKTPGIKLIENLNEIVVAHKDKLSPEFVSVIEIGQMFTNAIMSKDNSYQCPEKIFVDMTKITQSNMFKSVSLKNKDQIVEQLAIIHEKTLLNSNLNVENKDILKKRL